MCSLCVHMCALMSTRLLVCLLTGPGSRHTAGAMSTRSPYSGSETVCALRKQVPSDKQLMTGRGQNKMQPVNCRREAPRVTGASLQAPLARPG